jgi:hypothetical protein
VLTAVQSLLEKARRPMIVIVHGDHGPAMDLDLYNLEHADVRQRFRIFLSVRWPNSSEPTPTIVSPVNVYRYVFRHYFGVDLALLPDKAFRSNWPTPYVFSQVQIE